MTISKFDKPTLRSLREDVDQALRAVAEKHGITLSLGSIKFDATSFTGQLKATVLNPATGVVPTEEREFHAYARMFGFEPSDYRRVVRIDGVEYRMIGFKTRAPRRPVVLERVHGPGGGVVCSPEYVQAFLTRQAA